MRGALADPRRFTGQCRLLRRAASSIAIVAADERRSTSLGVSRDYELDCTVSRPDALTNGIGFTIPRETVFARQGALRSPAASMAAC